jgi:methylglutaconyl-CoA hydratase
MAMVQVQDAEGVRTVTLNRPERRNALVPSMQDELIAAFNGAANSGARVVVLRGEGESFCSGLDLDVLRGMIHKTARQHREEADRVARMFRAVWDCDVPTVAVVHRAAIAGGAGLAMLCDFTLAGTEALFGFTEARIGFVPALVGVYLGVLIGNKAARGLLLSAKPFSAQEAFRLGIVNEVFDQANLHDQAAALTALLLQNSPESLRATKQLLRAQLAPALDRALELAMQANAASRETAGFREGITAFVEKRKPKWQGSASTLIP